MTHCETALPDDFPRCGRCGVWLLAVCLVTGLGTGPARGQTGSRAEIRGVSPAFDAICQKVVKIFGAGGLQGLPAYGTGFLVSPEGHIVTVWSHVLDDRAVTVILDDGRKFEGRVLGAEPALDLAVVKIDAEDLPCFDLDKPLTAGPGAKVLAFGNIFKVATGDEPVSVLHGVISARTRLQARRGVFETTYAGPVYILDAMTNNPGAAGGALTTRDGVLLGMLGKELRNAQTNTYVNYAIPLAELKTPIQEIITGRFTSKKPDLLNDPSAPARYVPLDFGLVLIPDVVLRTPAFVDRVLPGSAAGRAGIQPDDLVLFVNDTLIPSCRVLREELGRLEAGDRLQLVLRRGEGLVSVELPVPKKPVLPARSPVNRLP